MKTLVILVGPSGYGKSTLINALVARSPTASTKLLASTSRSERASDKLESEYQDFDISHEYFEQHASEFFELTKFGSNYYGYSIDAVEKFVKSQFQTAYTFMSAQAFISVEDSMWSKLANEVGIDAFVCVVLHSLPETSLNARLISRETGRADFEFRKSNAQKEDTVERRAQIVERQSSLSIANVFRHIELDLIRDVSPSPIGVVVDRKYTQLEQVCEAREASVNRHCQVIETFLYLICNCRCNNIAYDATTWPILPNTTLGLLTSILCSMNVVLFQPDNNPKQASWIESLVPLYSNIADECYREIIAFTDEERHFLRQSFVDDDEPGQDITDEETAQDPKDNNLPSNDVAVYENIQLDLASKFGETMHTFYSLVGQLMTNYKKGKNHGLLPNALVKLILLTKRVVESFGNRLN